MDVMISTICWWFVYFILFTVAYNYLARTPWRNLPPGPLALPLVGSLPFLGTDPRKPLMKMAAKYGDVFTIYMGITRVVVLNGYDVIREAIVTKGKSFEDRPRQSISDAFSKGLGFAFTNGAIWKEQRRHCMYSMKELGQNMFENKIQEEVSRCIQELKTNSGKPFNPQAVLHISVANVIVYILCGRHYQYNAPDFIRYLKFIRRVMHLLGKSGIHTAFPFIRYLPGDIGALNEMETGVNELHLIYQDWINTNKSDLNVDEPPTNLIEAYLLKLSEKDCPKSVFNEKQLVGYIGDLFTAGSETVTTTLTWAIIYMVLNPTVQSRVQDEIGGIMDEHTMLTMRHKMSLPYTEACLYEIQRLADIAPLSVPRSTGAEEFHINGFTIPKGTTILCNLSSVLMDPKLWPEPQELRPARFLDDQGKVKIRKELIPYSTGKRQCAGEELARMELFLYFASIMKHFKFIPAPGYPLPDTVGEFGLVNQPKPFHIIMESRL